MNHDEIHWAENELRRIRRVASRKRKAGYPDPMLETGLKALEARLDRMKAEEKQIAMLRKSGLRGTCQECGEAMPLSGNRCWNCVERFSQTELFPAESN